MRKITQHFLFLALMLLGARGVSWAQNTPQKYTSAVDERSLQIGDTLAPGFSLTNINTADYLTFQAYRFKFGTSIIENNVAVGINNVTSYGDGDVTINAMGLYYPVDQLGNDGDAWIVVDIQQGFSNDLHYVLAGITLPLDATVPMRQTDGTWAFSMPGADKLVEVEYYPSTLTLNTLGEGVLDVDKTFSFTQFTSDMTYNSWAYSTGDEPVTPNDLSGYTPALRHAVLTSQLPTDERYLIICRIEENGNFAAIYHSNGHTQAITGNMYRRYIMDLLQNMSIYYPSSFTLPEGIEATTENNVYLVTPGTEVPLRAEADTLNFFNGWDDEDESGAVRNYTMGFSDASLLVHFHHYPVLSLASNDNTKGSVDIDMPRGTSQLNTMDMPPFMDEYVRTDGQGSSNGIEIYVPATISTLHGEMLTSVVIGVNNPDALISVSAGQYDPQTMTITGINATSVDVYSTESGVYLQSVTANYAILPQGVTPHVSIDPNDPMTGYTRYDVAPGTELTLVGTPVPVHFLSSWSDGSTEATRTFVMGGTDTTLTATFAPLSYLTIDVNDSTRGMAWINRHGVNLADELYPGHNEGSIFRCNTGTSIVDNCFNNSEDWFNGLWIEARYWDNRPTIAYVVFYHGTDSVIVTGSYPQVYLRNGNTYSDYNDNSLLWQGGVSRLRIYTNSYGLPDGVAETSVPGTYAVIPGIVLPIEAVPFSQCHLSGWSSGDTTLTFNYTMGDTFDTLTAYFDSNALLTIAVNAPQMGSVSIPRHQGNSLLVSLKAADMAGLSSPDFNGIHLFAPDVQQGGKEWTNSSSDWSREIRIQTNGSSGDNEKEKKTTIFYSNHNTRYIMTGGNDNSEGATLYLKDGNTYLDWSCSQLLWEGGVTRLEVYGKGKVLPDGVEAIDEANGLFSVAPGSQVPIQAKANPRHHLDSWSNGDAVTDDLMHTITVTTDTYDTAIFVVNPTLTLTSNDTNMGSVAFDVDPDATQQITIYEDGEATNDNIPFNGNFYDYVINTQYIIPAEELGAMQGGSIRAIRYHIIQTGGTPFTYSTSSTVYLKEVDYTTFGTPASKDTLTPVCTTFFTITSEGDYFVIDIPFDEPFEYHGGNLLVFIDHPQGGNFRFATFIGQEVSSSAYASLYNSIYNFIPKSTFTFTSPMPAGVYAINDTTYSVDPGTELTIKPVAALGYNFSSWEDLSTTPLRSFTMGYNDAAFTASFVASPKLVCLTDGTGTGSVVIDTTGGMPFGVSVNPEGGYFVPAGTQVTLMALPDEENHFVAWENQSTDASRIFTMGNADDTVNATIDINTYILDSILSGWTVIIDDTVTLTLTPSTAFPGTMQAELPWGHDVEIIPSDTHKPLVRKLEVLLPNSITIGDVTIHYDNGDTWAQAISRPENSVSYVYIENNTVKYIDFTLQLNDVDVNPNDTIQANGEYEWYVEYSGSITLDP